VLGSANSHSGGTTVNAGTLAVTANGALGTPGVTDGVIFGTGVGATPATGTARDANWTMVAVPSNWTPPSAVPYAAYVPRTVSAAMVGGNTSSVQNGYTVSGTTVYWISPQSTVTGLVSGTYNWIVAQEFNVVRDGDYSFTFGGAGDNEISFFIGGTIDTSNPVTPVITGGQQIGTTWNSYTTVGTLSGTASLTAGTHTAYMVLRDTGGDTGALITQSSFTPPAGTIVNAGSTLDLRNVAYTTSDLITLNGATLATSTGSSSWAGTVSLASASTVDVTGDALSILGAISGSGSFAKTGAGNLILAGTSTFTGPTSVSAGRLSVNGALGNTAVTVASAAELGGSGSIVGALAVLAGGTLAPGNSIDSLAGGATSFAAGSTFGYEVNSSLLGSLGTAADLLVVSGNLDIASGTLLSFTDITSGTVQPFVEDTTVFAMINYSGAWNGGLFTYNGTPLADGSRFTVGSQQWEIDYNSPTGGSNYTSDYLPSSSFVTVMAVPEPGTLALAAVGVGLAVFAGVSARRRKRLRSFAILEVAVTAAPKG
jgi:autotransporter-associated beta strand protein